jgi:predicted O-methyltransferase YrrM
VKGKPCWAPGAAEYLESLLTGEEVAFEWGSGESTRWLASRVREVVSVETDQEWFERVTGWLKDQPHVEVIHTHIRSTNYLNNIKLRSKFRKETDRVVWLIDGYRRIDCLELVEKLVRPGDIVVCDDSADYLDGRAPSHAKTFSQPHPHAGIPINHAKYGALRNTLLKVHHDTKDTTIWRV